MIRGSTLRQALQSTGAEPNPIREFLRGWVAEEFLLAVQISLAVLALAAFYYLSKYLVRLLGRPIARRFQRQSVAQTVLRGIRLATLVLGTFVAGAILGLRFPDIVLSVTVFSAVLGIVLAPIIGSLIGGLFVLADQPYEVGDMIELDSGQRGFVDDITLRYTKIITLDNTLLIISNSDIRDRDVVNYSAEDERTRLSLRVAVTYESDVSQARDLLESAAGGVSEVVEGGPDIRIGSARYPAKPTCYIDEFGDHGVLLTMRYWAKTPYKLLTVRSKVQTRAWERLADPDVDVKVPYPHQHLVFDDTSGEAQVAMRELTAAADADRPSPPTEFGDTPAADRDAGSDG